MSLFTIEKWNLTTEEQEYQIMVSIPNVPAPSSGFPVLYVLDGNAFFNMFTEIARLQSFQTEEAGVSSMIIVGIGYPGSDPFHSRRFADLTTPIDEKNIPERPVGSSWPESGKAELFLQVLTDVLQKEIEGRYSVDVNKQTLYGHSLGGLFALYTLFQKPSSFQNYFASSPSIWWNNKSILDLEKVFNTEIKIKNTIKLFITAGTEEAAGDVFENVKALYERILTNQKDGLQIELFAGVGENHMSIVPAAFNKGIRFLSSINK